MKKFLLVFAILGLSLVFGAVAEEEFDSFSVTAAKGDTPWAQWESYESTKAVPWELWLNQFAEINNVVPNAEESFRHLPVGEWQLPIYQSVQPEEVILPTAEKTVAEIEIPEETIFTVVSQSAAEVKLEETQVKLATTEESIAKLKAEQTLLEDQLIEAADLLSARDAEVVKLQTLLASKEEALKAALEVQATTVTTVVVDRVWGLTPKQVLGGALFAISLVILSAGAVVWRFRKNAAASRSSIARELTRVAGEKEAVCKQLKEAWKKEKKLERLVERLNKTNLDLSNLSEEPVKMLYKFNLPQKLVTKRGLKSHIYIPILRQPGPDQEMRVLLLEENDNGHLSPGAACKISAVKGKLEANPERHGLFVTDVSKTESRDTRAVA